MNLVKQIVAVAGGLSLGILLSGCGSKDEVAVAPPPPPSSPGVTLKAGPEAVAPPTGTAPEGAPAPGVAAPPPGAAAPEGPVDQFKGMTPEQIAEFKATATPETHDMNIAPLNEAVTGFAAEFKRLPASQEELVKARYLSRVLTAPKGKKYVINPETGEVTSEPVNPTQ